MSLAEYQPGLGKRLALARLRAGMTQFQLAEAAGVKSSTMISRYERGVRSPRITTLDALSDALDVPINRLLGAK